MDNINDFEIGFLLKLQINTNLISFPEIKENS